MAGARGVGVKVTVLIAFANRGGEPRLRKSGEDILHDKDVKHTMKQVVKKAAKEAVKDAKDEKSAARSQQ